MNVFCKTYMLVVHCSFLGFVLGISLSGTRACAQDRVLPHINIEVPEIQEITNKDQEIRVEGLIRGVPTQIAVTLRSPRLIPSDAVALVKSCSCFSARLEDVPAKSADSTVVLKIVLIPGERAFRQKISFFRRADQLHDGSGSGPQFDGKLCIDSVQLVGRTIDPVSIQVADSRVPDAGEYRTITVKSQLENIKIDPVSVKVTSRWLSVEPVASSNDQVFEFKCRTKDASQDATGYEAVNDNYTANVTCDFFVEGLAAKIPFNEELQFWNNSLVRIIPPRLLVARGGADEELVFSVIDARTLNVTDDENPYRFRYVSANRIEEQVEIIKFQRVSEKRWLFTAKPPLLMGKSSTRRLQLVDKDDLEAAPARTSAMITTF